LERKIGQQALEIDFLKGCLRTPVHRCLPVLSRHRGDSETSSQVRMPLCSPKIRIGGARSLRAVSEAPLRGSMNQVGVWRRLRYSDLKEAACVRGGRYGISIDFGLEVVERLRTCGETFKSKFIDPTMEPKLTNRLIVTKDVEFFKTAGLESPMPRASGTRQRPPQSGFVVCWACSTARR
jgi:hypothetical protein